MGTRSPAAFRTSGFEGRGLADTLGCLGLFSAGGFGLVCFANHCALFSVRSSVSVSVNCYPMCMLSVVLLWFSNGHSYSRLHVVIPASRELFRRKYDRASTVRHHV